MIRFLRSAALAALALAPMVRSQDSVFPFPYTISDFDNGLRLVTVDSGFPGVVAVHCIVSVGSRHEIEEGKSGFAHFFEHMMFRGTKNLTSAEQAAAFKAAGADRNAYTTDDYTNYHTVVPTEELETVLRLEADRFRWLEYSEKAFRTEAMAVLGEYNKGSSDPINKLFEVIRENTFRVHTYRHTTIGFLRDIRKMPTQFDYSRTFFERFYRPEYVTLLVVGDVEHARVQELVERYWGDWERGSHVAEIPAEPPPSGPVTCHVDWPTPTLPWVVVAFRTPAFSTTEPDLATLDVLASLAFSESSELYARLYVRERKVDVLSPYFPDRTDPYLGLVLARVKDPADWAYVRDAILATFERLKQEPVDPERLAAVKSNLRYAFAAGLDSSASVANALAGYLARTRTPAAVDAVHALYAATTPERILEVARRWFVPEGRVIATLSHEPLPEAPEPGAAATDADAAGAPPGVFVPSRSPLVTFRLQFPGGSRDDPEGKAGLAEVTARMLVEASTEKHDYQALLAAFYPMAAGVSATVGKELTVVHGTVHRDNLEAYYALLREMLTEPAFDADDLERIKASTINAIDVGLRRSDDEETGKEVLYGEIFAGTPYEHPTLGTIEGVRSITRDDVVGFWKEHFREPVVGLAGGFDDAFAHRVVHDFAGRPAQRAEPRPIAVEPIPHNRVTIVAKQALATGLHLGFPIDVPRGHPDWVALWLARSWLGEHRSENSHLYQRLREVRGLNYGDYAYIEYFPHGGRRMQPEPNHPWQQPVFSIWIRPVPPENAAFALKAAWYELSRLVENGLTEEAFESTRAYLERYCALLVATDDRRLGYALDSAWFGTPDFVEYVREGLAQLILGDVNAAIARHLRTDRLQIVAVAEDAEGLRDALLSPEPTPISYGTPPDQAVLEEDAIIAAIRLDLEPEHIRIVQLDDVFLR